MTKDLIFEKQNYYRNKLNELVATNIDEVVEERLKAERERVRQAVQTELANDIHKCKTYLELLDELDRDIQAEKENECAPDDIVNCYEVEEHIANNEEVQG